MKRRIEIVIMIALGITLTGCGGGKQHQTDLLSECEQENTTLSAQVQTLKSENTELTEQVNTLSKLDARTRLESLDTLKKICIGKHSGFYDKNEDGKNETLVVYLEPLDTVQDFVKAIGAVKIELWDLDEISEKAKLSEWTLKPSDLHKTWGGTIFHSYYRIKLPLEDIPLENEEYTVKVTFTDYLSGKVLTDQKVLKTQ